MYHILEPNDNQPVILWHSGNILQKYIINNGRIFNRGVVLKDINRNFKVWNISMYISYESVDSSTVICQMTNDSITEVFTTKNLSAILEHNNKLFIFSLVPNKDKYDLLVTCSDNFSEQHLICDNLDLSESLHVTTNNDFIVVFLKDKLLFVSSELELVTTLSISSSKASTSINLQNEVSQLKFELHQLEEHHSDFVKEYERLASYTGELQEKLRRTKLNIEE